MSLLIIGTINFNLSAYAKDKPTNRNEKTVNAKCYVELVGGGETISLWSVKPSLLKTLANNIVGQKIIVISMNQPKSKKQKSTIYRAKECILEENEFSSPIARAMDKELPR